MRRHGLELVPPAHDSAGLRVVVADDQPMVRAGLSTELNATEGIEVVAEAETGVDAVRATLAHRPDVLVLDLHLREMSGVGVIREVVLRAPETRVLVFSAIEDDGALLAAVSAGARGYLLKNSTNVQLVRGVHVVAAGESIFSPDVATRISALLSRPPDRDHYPFPDLTVREREVLDLLAAGMQNSAIARKLNLASKTISNYISNIYAKLRLADRAEAIVRARDAGLGRRTADW